MHPGDQRWVHRDEWVNLQEPGGGTTASSLGHPREVGSEGW